MAKKRATLKAPLPMSNILGGVFGRRGALLVDTYRVQKSWEQIVGAELARRTYPKRIQRDVLLVAVENPAWAQHLSMMKDEILQVIRERTGRKFSDLRFENRPIPVRS